jgi:DNA polymerase III subunit delta
VYLLTGEEFLASEALTRVRAEEAIDPLSEITLDAGAPAPQIIESLETASLLGGRRLVVVLGAGGLKKDQVEAIERYLDSPSERSVLVLVASGRSKLSETVKRVGTVVSLEAPRGRRLASWVRNRAGDHGLKLDDKSAWALIDAVGTDLRELDGSLGQLATGVGDGSRIDVATVRKAFARLADEPIYAFTDAVGERRMADAMTTLRRLLQQGEPPLVVFGALSNHVRRLLQAHRLETRKAVGAMFGMPDWRAERLLKQARSYREEELTGAMRVLADTDVEMKGDAPLPEVPLERAVARIVAGRVET